MEEALQITFEVKGMVGRLGREGPQSSSDRERRDRGSKGNTELENNFNRSECHLKLERRAQLAFGRGCGKNPVYARNLRTPKK